MARQPRGGRAARMRRAILGIAVGSLAVPPVGAADQDAAQGGSASDLLHVPVVDLQPGGVPQRPTITSPVADDRAPPRAACRTSPT